MNFKEWLISEHYFTSVRVGGDGYGSDVKLYKNSSYNESVNLLYRSDLDEVKGVFIQDNGDIYLWNAGIFLFRAKDMIAAFQSYALELMDPVNDAIENGYLDFGFFRLAAEPWKTCKNISIDHAILEKVDNLSSQMCLKTIL